MRVVLWGLVELKVLGGSNSVTYLQYHHEVSSHLQGL